MRTPITDRTRELLQSARYEVLPTSTITDKVLAHAAPGLTFTVTASTSLGLEATLRVAEDLQRAGRRAVPHLAARMISGKDQLREVVARLSEAGITEVFVPGGDATPPAGDYVEALDLLRDLQDISPTFTEIGVAGYPEPHPVISDAALRQALDSKSPYATNLVSNLCFDPSVLGRWVSDLRSRGFELPLLLGIPGKVQLAKLASVASAIGVGESAKFLRRNTSTFARLLRPDGYAPHRLIERVLRDIPDAAEGVAGLHIYTFNQIAKTEQWRVQQLGNLG